MSGKIDYKQKYEELKMKYMESVDLAFRLGIEEGTKQAQQQQMQDFQMQQQQLQQDLSGQQGQDGSIPQSGQENTEQMSQNPQSELDQHISTLEGMMNSGNPQELQKALEGLKSFRKEQLQHIQMKKSEQAISGIEKALHKPQFKLSAQSSHNLTDSAKQSIGLQHKIVSDVMDAWDIQEKQASGQITKLLND